VFCFTQDFTTHPKHPPQKKPFSEVQHGHGTHAKAPEKDTRKVVCFGYFLEPTLMHTSI